MRHVQLFESWLEEDEIVLSKGRLEIRVVTRRGTIERIDNETGIKFPFFTGQPVTVFMKGWACSHGFKWNGESACPDEEKVFGIKKKHVPQDHWLRMAYPSKFK
jgi:hypothetical protein